MRREAATALRVQRHPLHPLLGGGFQFAREGAGPEHEDDVLEVGLDLGGRALRPFAEGLPLHHAAHPQVRDRQPRFLADFAHCAGRDGLSRLHVPAWKRQPAHGFVALGSRCCTRMRPVTSSSIMHMLQRVTSIVYSICSVSMKSVLMGTRTLALATQMPFLTR